MAQNNMWYSIISIFNCHSSFDKQCFSVVSWLIVAVSQYFVALHAQHFPSRFAYAQLEEKCWAFRQQNIVTRLQWALIQLRNIAYSHKEWQRKNTDNFNITIVIVCMIWFSFLVQKLIWAWGHVLCVTICKSNISSYF